MTPPDFQDEPILPDDSSEQDELDFVASESDSPDEAGIVEHEPPVFESFLDDDEQDDEGDIPNENQDSSILSIAESNTDVESTSEDSYEDAFEGVVIPQSVFEEPPDEPIGEFEVTEPISENVRDFEDLNLSELVGQFVSAPRRTWSALLDVMLTPSVVSTREPITIPASPIREANQSSSDDIPQSQAMLEDNLPDDAPADVHEFTDMNVDRAREALKLIGYLVAFGFACVGNWLFVRTTAIQVVRTESVQLANGIPWLMLAILIWFVAEIYGNFPQLKQWWYTRKEQAELDNQPEQHKPHHNYDISILFKTLPLTRVGFMWMAIVLALLTWLWTSDNRFTFEGVVTWVGSITFIVLAVAPDDWNIVNLSSRFKITLPQTLSFEKHWATYVLVMIVLLGALFRFTDFSGTPPEMTSDHVEKLLDAQRVFEGEYHVFFANNGGREPFQMYALALMSNLPGLNMSHDLLLLLANLESLITLPLLFWMGREVVGQRDRRFGTIVGLILAGLVAVSYWHTSITRLALRIVLTPLIASLLMIYLSRGMRANRRADFIKAGLVLGFGLYTYQAVRMLPVVVVAGVLFALMRNFRRPQWRTQYILHLMVLVIVSFVVFAPLARYWQQSPESFGDGHRGGY